MATDNLTSIRMRLTGRECADLDRVRAFLGLQSLSATAKRLALWNARALSAALASDAPVGLVDAVGDNISDMARLAMRQAIREAGR